MTYPICRSGRQERLGSVQRRAVTRRASRIFAPESCFRKQEAAKSGQTCVEQFEEVARTSTRSPLARAATSPASSLGAKPGNAITEAPTSTSIANAERDLTIWGLLTCWLDPSACRRPGSQRPEWEIVADTQLIFASASTPAQSQYPQPTAKPVDFRFTVRAPRLSGAVLRTVRQICEAVVCSVAVAPRGRWRRSPPSRRRGWTDRYRPSWPRRGGKPPS